MTSKRSDGILCFMVRVIYKLKIGKMKKRQLKARMAGELIYKMLVEMKQRGVYGDPFEAIKIHGGLTIVCKN